MSPSLIACLTLLGTFALFLVYPCRYAGFGPKVFWPWHPAKFIAQTAILRTKKIYGLLSIGGAALLLAGMLADGSGSQFCAVGFVFWLGPLPFYLLEAARKHEALLSREVVYINVFSPITTRHDRTIKDGKLVEETPDIWFYLPDSEFAKLTMLRKEDYTFLQQFAVVGGLYRAPAKSDFLQLFDSFCLYPYLIHPDNKMAMAAFEDALRCYFVEPYRDGTKLPKLLPPRPHGLPVGMPTAPVAPARAATPATPPPARAATPVTSTAAPATAAATTNTTVTSLDPIAPEEPELLSPAQPGDDEREFLHEPDPEDRSGTSDDAGFEMPAVAAEPEEAPDVELEPPIPEEEKHLHVPIAAVVDTAAVAGQGEEGRLRKPRDSFGRSAAKKKNVNKVGTLDLPTV